MDELEAARAAKKAQPAFERAMARAQEKAMEKKTARAEREAKVEAIIENIDKAITRVSEWIREKKGSRFVRRHEKKITREIKRTVKKYGESETSIKYLLNRNESDNGHKKAADNVREIKRRLEAKGFDVDYNVGWNDVPIEISWGNAVRNSDRPAVR